MNSSLRSICSIIAFAGLALLPTRLMRAAPPTERHGMIRIPEITTVVGTSLSERQTLAKEYGCDATWLAGDLDRVEVALPAFWIDRHPVTNAQYQAFVQATGARNPWPRQIYPADRADHPVVGVSFPEAEAYARWAGKRLPSGEEWEVAARGANGGRFPWGNDWPGPVKLDERSRIASLDPPATRPIGAEPRIASAAGMQDLAQVCEWTTTSVSDRGKPRNLLKGASWFYRDPVNFRTAAGCFVPGPFYSPLIGFRCALNGDQQPPEVPQAQSEQAIADQADGRPPVPPGDRLTIVRATDAPPALRDRLGIWHRHFIGETPETSRGFVIGVPRMSPWPISLLVCEGVRWNRKVLLAGQSIHVPFHVEEGPTGAPICRIELDPIDLRIEFSLGDDYIDQSITVTSKSDQPGLYDSSSCLAMISHPDFYDCEGTRTFVLTRRGGFVPTRAQIRDGRGNRWITTVDLTPHGGLPDHAVMAVTSRDGSWTFGATRAGRGEGFSARTNAWLTCLHCDANLRIGPGEKQTFVRRYYCIRGGLDDLQRRFERDRGQGVFDRSR